jgi:hypothetical protein
MRADVYLNDLDRLRPRRRVWVLFTHEFAHLGGSEVQHLVSYLDATATRLDRATADGAAVSLYALDPSSPADRRPWMQRVPADIPSAARHAFDCVAVTEVPPRADTLAQWGGAP